MVIWYPYLPPPPPPPPPPSAHVSSSEYEVYAELYAAWLAMFNSATKSPLIENWSENGKLEDTNDVPHDLDESSFSSSGQVSSSNNYNENNSDNQGPTKKISMSYPKESTFSAHRTPKYQHSRRWSNYDSSVFHPPSENFILRSTSIDSCKPLYSVLSTSPEAFVATETIRSLAEATTDVNLSSFLKISSLLCATSLLCYAAVAPRTLPLSEYNVRFFENIRITSLALIGPAAIMLSVYDARQNNDINSVINTFFVAATIGYFGTILVEILTTTALRLVVFAFLERDIFVKLTPKVPMVILPWVLRENRYRPKRITLFVADFLTSCIAAPLVEEYAKLFLLQSTTALPRNFNWSVKNSPNRQKKKRRETVAEPVIREKGELDIVNANQYVTSMLAVSLGLKLCDAFRRILLYTKPHNKNKAFFSVLRGWFPIQEICGTMTAIGLAKRDLLGIYVPMWKLLTPAVLIHATMNFKGMKPFFKWNSLTPWTEMLLSPLDVPDTSTLPQLLLRGYRKLMWIVLMSRVISYCIKNYYMVNRQALKRITTYAGNPAAFTAEIATAEMLKSRRKQ